jgi:hypothetical protein
VQILFFGKKPGAKRLIFMWRRKIGFG